MESSLKRNLLNQFGSQKLEDETLISDRLDTEERAILNSSKYMDDLELPSTTNTSASKDRTRQMGGPRPSVTPTKGLKSGRKSRIGGK